jgi:hypothetical protein
VNINKGSYVNPLGRRTIFLRSQTSSGNRRSSAGNQSTLAHIMLMAASWKARHVSARLRMSASSSAESFKMQSKISAMRRQRVPTLACAMSEEYRLRLGREIRGEARVASGGGGGSSGGTVVVRGQGGPLDQRPPPRLLRLGLLSLRFLSSGVRIPRLPKTLSCFGTVNQVSAP